MWNLLKKNKGECGQLRDSLEGSAAARRDFGNLEELIACLPLAQRDHIAACGTCREAALDVLASRKMFKGVAARGEEAGPWFAARVMRAIAAQEQKLSLAVSPWTAVPRFAARLTWAAAIVLLGASAWLYERPAPAPVRQPASASSQEYLFEPPAPPINQDDVLISMAEKIHE